MVSKIIHVSSLGRPAFKCKRLKSIYDSEDSINIFYLKQKPAISSSSPFRSGRLKTERIMGNCEEISEKTMGECEDISLGEIKRRCKAKRRNCTVRTIHDRLKTEKTMSDCEEISEKTMNDCEDISLGEIKRRCKAKRRNFTVPKIHDRLKTEKTMGDCEEISKKTMDDCEDISLGEIKRRCKAKRRKFTVLKIHDKDTSCSRSDTFSEASYTVVEHREDEVDLEGSARNIHTNSDVRISEFLNDVASLAEGKTSPTKAYSTSLCIVPEPILAGLVELPQNRSQNYPSHVLELKNEGLSISHAAIAKDVDFQQLRSYDSPSFLVLETRNDGLSISYSEIAKGATNVKLQQLSSQDSPSSPELDSKNEAISVNDADVKGISNVPLKLGSNDFPFPARAELGAIEDYIFIPENKIESDSISTDPMSVSQKTEVLAESVFPGAEISRSGQVECCSKGITSLVNIDTATHMSESDSKEDQTFTEEDNVVNAGINFPSSQISSPCSSLGTDSDSVGHHSPTGQPVRRRSSPTTDEPVADVIEVLDCSSITASYASNRFANVELLEDHHGRKLDYSSKPLFSARKAISPSSQEKLLQAIDADVLHDKRMLSTIRIKRSKVKFNTNVLEKSKIMKNGFAPFIPKSILKAECAPVATCADKAVAFTQRQMLDIEGLAMMLMKHLKSMKEVVEQSLQFSSAQLRYNIKKIRVTTENATKAEKTTKKWLSMMSKDCNRFCNILKTTEKKAASASSLPSSYVVHKKRRRLTFADETGGTLCHVKIIEDSQASLLDLENKTAITKTK
ncbi:hypothetical protein MKW94_002275 [Papaver nudicaule]|uniref:Uncharacterized protein n=1 Tax=Papaver nudicaule TaxID=74823 RepID=A0AA42AQN3_PAPNU|nr:hypothetical protein [Papaver nudicaule]